MIKIIKILRRLLNIIISLPSNQENYETKRVIKPQRDDLASYKRGDLICGKYEVYGTLGKGGFGVVLLVYHRDIGEVCALKTFRSDILTDPRAREAFKKEAILWINLEEHPFILAARCLNEESGRLFVVMDAIAADAQGRVSLADHLASATEPLESKQILKWAIQFCLGMVHVRNHGIQCHRDIKPQNILITRDRTLKISDFGLAAAAEAALLKSDDLDEYSVSRCMDSDLGFSLMYAEGKVRCGTPGYMAPEVYRYESADIRSDIYSFGLVLWQMTSGSPCPPWTAQWRGDMQRYMNEIYEEQMEYCVPRMNDPLGSVIERCLRPIPSERYSNFQELLKDLESIWVSQTGRPFEIPKIEEQTASFWSNKGAALTVLKLHKKAIACFDKAIAINPDQVGFLSNKGMSLSALGRHEEAIECYDKALNIDPKLTYTWNNKGLTLHALNRHEDAIKCYDKALNINPLLAYAMNNKGLALSDLHQYEPAIEWFTKALEINPRYLHAWENKGNAFSALGRYEEAMGCYNKELEIDPISLSAWHSKAHLNHILGKHEDAIECYNNIIKIDPADSSAWNDKGSSLLALSRHHEAIICYDKALNIDARNASAWNNKGHLLHALGQHEAAIACYDKALEIDALFSYAWNNKAITLNALDRQEEAIRCLDKALEIDPMP